MHGENLKLNVCRLCSVQTFTLLWVATVQDKDVLRNSYYGVTFGYKRSVIIEGFFSPNDRNMNNDSVHGMSRQLCCLYKYKISFNKYAIGK